MPVLGRNGWFCEVFVNTDFFAPTKEALPGLFHNRHHSGNGPPVFGYDQPLASSVYLINKP